MGSEWLFALVSPLILRERPSVHKYVRKFWRLHNFGCVFAVLLVIPGKQIQEEIRHFVGWEGGG